MVTNVIILALIATCGTWLLTAMGSATVFFFKRTSENVLNIMIGFSAGVMIAASFWSLLEPAIELAERTLSTPAYIVAAGGFVCGALFIWGSDKVVTYARRRVNEDAEENVRFRRVLMLVLSITLHNIPEGLAVGIAFGALGGAYSSEAMMGAVSVAVGIGLQNFPEGAAVSLPLRREGCTRMKSFLLGQASGMVEPIAGVVGAALILHVKSILPFALAFAAGAMILVAVHELIPECRRSKGEQPYLATMGIIAGFTAMMILDVMLG